MNTLQLQVKASNTAKDFYTNHKAAFAGDSGIDLFFPRDVICPGNRTTMIDLEISCMMRTPCEPHCNYDTYSYYVYPRSSISKTPLIMHNSVGIIDAGYRNTIKVAVYNTGENAYCISKGDRLFQICAHDLRPITMKVVEDLPSTNRGSGFGSSGTSGNITT